MSKYQGKIHIDWNMSPDTLSGIEFQMQKVVELEIKELRAQIINYYKNDLFSDNLQAEFMNEKDYSIKYLNISTLLSQLESFSNYFRIERSNSNV